MAAWENPYLSDIHLLKVLSSTTEYLPNSRVLVNLQQDKLSIDVYLLDRKSVKCNAIPLKYQNFIIIFICCVPIFILDNLHYNVLELKYTPFI